MPLRVIVLISSNASTITQVLIPKSDNNNNNNNNIYVDITPIYEITSHY